MSHKGNLFCSNLSSSSEEKTILIFLRQYLPCCLHFMNAFVGVALQTLQMLSLCAKPPTMTVQQLQEQKRIVYAKFVHVKTILSTFHHSDTIPSLGSPPKMRTYKI